VKVRQVVGSKLRCGTGPPPPVSARRGARAVLQVLLGWALAPQSLVSRKAWHCVPSNWHAWYSRIVQCEAGHPSFLKTSDIFSWGLSDVAKLVNIPHRTHQEKLFKVK
jgi:hypothetical protein